MDPILRRSLFYYLSTFVIYSGAVGRFLTNDTWFAFEAIPLLMPVYLLAAVVASEGGESYGFLRTLPVSDRRIVATKFALIGVSTALYWLAMMGITLGRMPADVTSPATLVYVTIVCAGGLLLAASCQIGIWRFGHRLMLAPALIVGGITLVGVVVHTARARHVPGWPAFTRTWPIDWLGRVPWYSVPALAALTAVAAFWLMRLGMRVKERSEAAL